MSIFSMTLFTIINKALINMPMCISIYNYEYIAGKQLNDLINHEEYFHYFYFSDGESGFREVIFLAHSHSLESGRCKVLKDIFQIMILFF